MSVPSAGRGGIGKAKKLTFYYSHGQFWNKSGFAIFESGKGITINMLANKLGLYGSRVVY